jgi:hypothetical protein
MDKPDYIPNPQTNPIGYETGTRRTKGGASLKGWIATTLVILSIVGTVLWLLTEFLRYQYDVNPAFRGVIDYGLIGITVLVFAAIGGVALSLAFYVFGAASRKNILELPGGFPVASGDILAGWNRENAARIAMWATDQHFKVQNTLAEHSLYRNVTAYSPSIGHGSRQGAADTPRQLEDMGQQSQVIPVEDWLGWIDKRPHALLAAETGGGKSTTAKAILAPRIAAGEDIFIIDPHSSEWFSMPSVGGGENWTEVCGAINAVVLEYRQRLEMRDRHNRETGEELPVNHFKRLTVLLDEANNACVALDNAPRSKVSVWQSFTQVLGSGARKVNISIVLLAQSANVEDIGLSGSMRQNFTRITLDDRSIKLMISQEEKDPTRRRALYAALVGRNYPAVTVIDSQVHLLDRTGLDNYPRPANARACAWNGWNYEKRCSVLISEMPEASQNAIVSAEQNTERRDELARALFKRGKTFRQVAQELRDCGYKIDNDRLSQLRQEIVVSSNN